VTVLALLLGAMPHMDAGKCAQYEEFFMKQGGGRRHVRLGATSTIDEIIMGRDTDQSGHDPHKEFMSKFGGHAGVKSGEKIERGRKPGYAMSSTMDSVIWGRDFDKSGVDAHAKFAETHGGHAGSLTVEKGWRRAKKAGYSMASTMDSVVWGRDFDRSDGICNTIYDGSAGGASGHAIERPARKIIVGTSASMDEILTGRDMDGSDDKHAAFMSAIDSHAGVKTSPKPDRPAKKPGTSLKSCADNVIWGRDLDQSGDNFQQELFEGTFGGSAGALTGRMPKSARRAQEKEKMSKSTPDLTLKPSETQLKQQQPQREQSGSFSYRPPARSTSNGALTARESPKFRDPAASMVSPKSRDSGVMFVDTRDQEAGFPMDRPSPVKGRSTQSQCSTASSSAGSKPRWR